MDLREISIDEIDEPSYDVRSIIIEEDLEELAQSISEVGVLEPLRVFARDGRYEIEDGHRRYLAAKRIGLKLMPCIIIESGEGEREYKKLHANIHSATLTGLELARTMHHLIDEYGYTVENLSKVMRKSESRIRQILSIIKWFPDVVQAIEDHKISEGVGRYLNKVKDPAMRHYYMEYVIDGGATLNTVMAWAAKWEADQITPPQMQIDTSGPPPDMSYQPPTGRCTCCRTQVKIDGLLIMRFCGECYTDLQNAMPELWKVMREERADRFPDKPVEEKKEGVTTA